LYDTEPGQQYISPRNIALLARFLMGFTIARPSSVLNLQGIKMYSVEFELSSDEYCIVQNHSRDYVQKVAQIQQKGADSTNIVPFTSSIRAQQAAAHPQLHLAGGIAPGDRLQELAGGDEDNEDTEGAARKRGAWIDLIHQPNFHYHSARVDAFLEAYRSCRARHPNEKILVFSEYLTFLDLLEVALRREHGVHSLRFDGTCGELKRERVKCEFASADASIPLLITGRAGGLGLNLQCASIVIQTEIWWNHNWELQAYGRAYRSGQKKEVKVFRLFARNSHIEHIILRRQREKTATNNQIMRKVIRRHDEKVQIPGL